MHYIVRTYIVVEADSKEEGLDKVGEMLCLFEDKSEIDWSFIRPQEIRRVTATYRTYVDLGGVWNTAIEEN